MVRAERSVGLSPQLWRPRIIIVALFETEALNVRGLGLQDSAEGVYVVLSAMDERTGAQNGNRVGPIGSL